MIIKEKEAMDLKGSWGEWGSLDGGKGGGSNVIIFTDKF